MASRKQHAERAMPAFKTSVVNFVSVICL
jgi:hypothetical protein